MYFPRTKVDQLAHYALLHQGGAAKEEKNDGAEEGIQSLRRQLLRAEAMAEEKGLLLAKSLAESKRKDEELERLREEVSALKDKKSG